MIEDKEYPSNSRMKKTVPEPVEEKKPRSTKVITGTAQKQKRGFGKRIADIFLEDDTKNVGEYIVKEVLIPAGKSMICDIVGWGGFAEMLLFGSAGGRHRSLSRDSRNTSSVGQSRINYGGVSKIVDARDTARAPRTLSREARTAHNFDDILYDTRGAAEDVLMHLMDLVASEYQSASVADMYDLAGLDSTPQDQTYGWTDLAGAETVRVGRKYMLRLPRTEFIG